MVFSYDEYEEDIYEDYNELIEEEKISKREALARNFYDYDMLAKKSETDKAMIFVIFSEIAVSHVKILHSFKDYLEKNLTELDFKIIQQENKLTPQQYSDLASRKERVLQKLKNMSLDYFPRACWYYDELVEEVQKFINNFKLENENTDSIVTTVLPRFGRDCENTKSEKFIVYTTLAENLYNQGLTVVDGIEDVKHVLQSFSFKDVSDEQLTEEEQEKLADRIKSVLSNLK
ncbi:Imm3 family immunity protein [Lysinibacillus sp. NPDC056232]|uniref:Imm3 family immunity protein n=1 Tax=Lysinibacillus sp. NPDC056232 TaxID=3345756 RepID=UPI0035DC9C53